jgi:hypothetical protein
MRSWQPGRLLESVQFRVEQGNPHCIVLIEKPLADKAIAEKVIREVPFHAHPPGLCRHYLFGFDIACSFQLWRRREHWLRFSSPFELLGPDECQRRRCGPGDGQQLACGDRLWSSLQRQLR